MKINDSLEKLLLFDHKARITIIFPFLGFFFFLMNLLFMTRRFLYADIY